MANFKDSSGDAPRTLVLVIGESTQRGRMSLYGYPRETTPELDALHKSDPNFTVFNNVVTSRPYTIEILQQALTFANEKNPDLYLTQPSLMNMMKQAGYKTFWITNQQTMTARNTMLTVFSKQTDKQFYMNQQRTQVHANMTATCWHRLKKYWLTLHRKVHHRAPAGNAY